MTKVHKTTQEWRAILSPEAFHITREQGTERPYTGEYWNSTETGIYRCVCCDTPLFESDTKFDAGCGWPSYFSALNPDHVREEIDTSHGRTRTEIVCNICDAHLATFFLMAPTHRLALLYKLGSLNI